MAATKEARVLDVEAPTELARVLHLEPSERLDFVGGQYLIVDCGMTLPDGKRAKRAYSILSRDDDQGRLTIAARRIGDGLCSSWLQGRRPGDRIPFSGPWGKWLPDDARPRPTLVLATDTGITAALGLVSGAAFAPQLPETTLVWLVEDERYFLPLAWVRERLPPGLRFETAPVPPVGHPERLAVVRQAARRGPFSSLFLVGDGAVLHPLREERADAEVRVETFFNHLSRKSA